VAESDPFKWRHYQGEIVLLCVRWYLRYALSYRDLEEMMRERSLSIASQLRRCKYLNNIVEQDHRFIKRRVNPGLGFFSFNTARRTIGGHEIMNMLRKGQIEGIGKGDIQGQVRFVAGLFKVAASTGAPSSIFVSQLIFCNTPAANPSKILAIAPSKAWERRSRTRVDETSQWNLVGESPTWAKP
jgi:hypothetical protein